MLTIPAGAREFFRELGLDSTLLELDKSDLELSKRLDTSWDSVAIQAKDLEDKLDKKARMLVTQFSMQSQNVWYTIKGERAFEFDIIRGVVSNVHVSKRDNNTPDDIALTEVEGVKESLRSTLDDHITRYHKLMATQCLFAKIAVEIIDLYDLVHIDPKVEVASLYVTQAREVHDIFEVFVRTEEVGKHKRPYPAPYNMLIQAGVHNVLLARNYLRTHLHCKNAYLATNVSKYMDHQTLFDQIVFPYMKNRFGITSWHEILTQEEQEGLPLASGCTEEERWQKGNPLWMNDFVKPASPDKSYTKLKDGETDPNFPAYRLKDPLLKDK